MTLWYDLHYFHVDKAPKISSAAAPVIFILGGYDPGVWETEVPQWEVPYLLGTSGTETVCRHCLQILTTETIKI